MALVAAGYGSSSSEDESDVDPPRAQSSQVEQAPKTSSLSVKAKEVSYQSPINHPNLAGVADDGTSSKLFLSKLPDPQRGSAPSHSAASDLIDEVLEPFVKKVDYSESLEKPPARKKLTSYSELRVNSKKSGGKVRIGIPSLAKVDADEHGGESLNPAPKKPQSGHREGNRSLIGMLPPAQHAALKEVGRSLVPKVLTRAPPASSNVHPPKNTSKAAAKNSKAEKMAVPSDVPEEEAEEADLGGFFSLGGEESSSSAALSEGPAVKLARFSSDATCSISQASPSASSPSASSNRRPLLLPAARVSHPDVEDQPLVFQPHNAPSGSDGAEWTDPVGPSRSAGATGAGSSGSALSAWYGETEGAGAHEWHVPHDADEGSSEISAMLSDKEFLKIQGRSGRGGPPAGIEIVDVDMNERRVTEQDLMKGISQETGPVVLSTKKGEGPSSQQKRKHQITYLAHQAKVRELDLKNSWAESSATKRQSRQKYGF